MTRRPSPQDWDAHIKIFHQRHPGITEAVLGRCSDGRRNPYEWLYEGVREGPILDLACGSAPTAHFAADWVGVDASLHELTAADPRTMGRLIQGDATRLPFSGDHFQTVTSSMALMLIAPLATALEEIRRVVRRDGEVRVLLPSSSPLSASDRLSFAALATRLRRTQLFPPSPLSRSAPSTFAAAGLEIVTDQRVRFELPLRSRDDAVTFVHSLYLPRIDIERVEAANALVTSWTGGAIGIPLRRITARVKLLEPESLREVKHPL